MNPFDLLSQAKKVPEALKRVQTELSALRVEGDAGAGAVKVTMDGRYGVLSVKIDDAIYNEGKVVVEELVAAAIRDAVSKVERAYRDKVKEVMTSLGLPSNLPMPFMPSEE